MSFSVGAIFVNLVSLYFDSADQLLLLFIVLLFVLLLPNLLLLKESPGWLFKEKRFEQTARVLFQVWIYNGKPSGITSSYFTRLQEKMETDEFESPSMQADSTLTLLSKLALLWNNKEHRIALLTLSSLSSSLFCLYYGTSSNIQAMGFERIQYNGILSGATQGLGFVIVSPFLYKYPRRTAFYFIQSFILACTGLLFLLSFLGLGSASGVIQGIIANLLISLATSAFFCFLYIANAESFPAHIRGIAVGVILLTGKLVGSLAPILSTFSASHKLHVLVGCALPMIGSLLLTTHFKETLLFQ